LTHNVMPRARAVPAASAVRSGSWPATVSAAPFPLPERQHLEFSTIQAIGAALGVRPGIGRGAPAPPEINRTSQATPQRWPRCTPPQSNGNAVGTGPPAAAAAGIMLGRVDSNRVHSAALGSTRSMSKNLKQATVALLRHLGCEKNRRRPPSTCLRLAGPRGYGISRRRERGGPWCGDTTCSFSSEEAPASRAQPCQRRKRAMN